MRVQVRGSRPTATLVVLGVRTREAVVVRSSLEGGGRSARRSGTGGLALASVLVLAACAGSSPTGPANVTTSGYAGFPSCVDASTITADAALYRDEPRYGNAFELVARVRAWASAKAGFEELWLDTDHNGWVTVGFHGADVEDIAALQEQVAEEFPGEGVVVVAVPYTLAELQALMDRVMPSLAAADAPVGGVGLDVPRGVLSVSGVLAGPKAEEALRQFAGEPLCVDAVDASSFVPEGDQPTEGEGWRLLGHADGAGQAYRTGVATTEGQLAALWQESGFGGEAPDVDWQSEIVVWFGAVYGGGCPVRLDGVAVDGATMHGEIVIPGVVMGCDGDARPHSFVVAVDRALLPAGPFVVQLGASDPPPGAPEERTVVDVDLSAPGSAATDDQLHLDPNAGPQPGPVIEDGYGQMPGQGARYVWHPRPQCSGVVIGPIDGTVWRLADGEATWTEVDGQEVTFNPLSDDRRIVVSSPGMDYLFVRAPGSTCDS